MDVSTLQHKSQGGAAAGRVRSKSSEDVHAPKSSGPPLAARPIDHSAELTASAHVSGQEQATPAPSLLQDGATNAPLRSKFGKGSSSSISQGGVNVASIPPTARIQELPPLDEVDTNTTSPKHFSKQGTRGFYVSYSSPFEAEAADTVESPLVGHAAGGAEQNEAKEELPALVGRHDADRKPSVPEEDAETRGGGSQKEQAGLLDGVGVGCPPAAADLQESSGGPSQNPLSPPTTLPEIGEAKSKEGVGVTSSDQAQRVSNLDSGRPSFGYKGRGSFSVFYSNPSDEQLADSGAPAHVESVAGPKSDELKRELRALVERRDVSAEKKQATFVPDAGASTSEKPKAPNDTGSDN